MCLDAGEITVNNNIIFIVIITITVIHKIIRLFWSRKPLTDKVTILRTTDYSFFESMEEFKYLGTTLTNQNSIQEEIKSRLKSGNACCHWVQNVLCYSLVSLGAECFVLQFAVIGCRMFCVTVWCHWVQNVLCYSLVSLGAECFVLQFAVIGCRMFCVTVCCHWVQNVLCYSLLSLGAECFVLQFAVIGCRIFLCYSLLSNNIMIKTT
jgi:UDP-3-O-[3-hydroxymyristoyl] glucosamine N-acyltransferase